MIALLQTDEATGPDTVFGAAVSTVQSYLLLVSGGVALLVASAAWRRLRPRDLTELDAEPEGARAEERSEH